MGENVFTKKDGKKGFAKWIIIGAAIIVAVVAAVVIILGGSKGRTIKRELNLAEKYVTELDYESAIAAYKKVIELDSKNVEAYIGIINCYRTIDDIESAFEWAEKGYDATSDGRLKELADELNEELTEKLNAENSSDADKQETDGGSDSNSAEENTENTEEGGITAIVGSSVFADYDYVSNIFRNICVVSKDGLYGAVNTDGEVVVPLTYESSDYWYAPDDNGHFILSDGTYYYLYNSDGVLITTSENEIIRHNNYYIIYNHVHDYDFYNTAEMYSLETYDYYTYDNQFVLSTNIYEFDYEFSTGYLPSSTLDGGELVYDIELIDESELGITSDNRDEYYDNFVHEQNFDLSYKRKFYINDSICVKEKTGILDADGNINWIETYKGPGYVEGSVGDGGWNEVTGLSYPISSYIDGAVFCVTSKYGEYCLRTIDFESGTFSDIKETLGNWQIGYNYYYNSGIWGIMCNYGSKIGYKYDGYTDGEKKTTYILDDITDNGIVNIGSYDYLGISEEKYWLIKSENSWGYIDHDGNVVAMYDDASRFRNGYAGVIKDGVGYVIDDSLNIVDENIPATGCAMYGNAIRFTTEDGYLYYLITDND